MKILMAQAIVLCILLAATVSFESANALPYRWSDYYWNQNVARYQEQCPVNEPSFDCKTARLTVPAGGSNAFVHICPNSGNDQQPVCYNSRLRRCCRSNVEGNAFNCASATKATVGGHQVTIEIYEHPTEGHCVYFDSDVDVRSCCNPIDEELPCVCVPKRDIFFVLDATQSIGDEIFCRFGYVLQLIEDAIRPRGIEGARVATVLFQNQLQGAGAAADFLFNLDDTCSNVVSNLIPRVVYEYYLVHNSLTHGPLKYPQVDSRSTLPYSALSKVEKNIDVTRPTSVVILTDGNPQQDTSRIVDKLAKKAHVIIAAGIGSETDINEMELRKLTNDPSNVVYESDSANVIGFAIKIVDIMKRTGALCSSEASDIMGKLQERDMGASGSMEDYCRDCMWKTPDQSCIRNRFPTCGANNLQMQMASSMDNKEELEKLILEEQILAEVEKIMEMDGELREQELPKEQFISLTPV